MVPKYFLTLFFTIVFLFSIRSVFAAVTCDSVLPDETPDMLQARLTECEQEIKVQQGAIADKQRESTNLERDIAILDYKVNKSKLEIQARNISILNLNNKIDEKSQLIDNLVGKIDDLRHSTAELMRRTGEVDGTSLVELILADKTVSDFYQDIGTFDSLEQSIDTALGQIRDTKTLEEKNKHDLEVRNAEERTLKAQQENESRQLLVLQDAKSTILAETKGQEKLYQQILSQKQKLADDIKNKILKLTGGGELKFEDAYKIVRLAEDALGIRSAFVLAILTQESGMNGVIGTNIGKCFYNQAWSNNSGTVMADNQKASFLYIIQQLGRDPNTTPVSCPISSDGQYGGAMGPSQFMPKTWWDIGAQTGYRFRIENITGSRFASPFDNRDAFTGTAIYLDDALSGCEQIYQSTFSRESCAAAKYYAGANWKKYMKSYGSQVANRANDFQKDIDVIESQ